MRKYYGVTETINGNNYTVEIWDEPTGLATTGDQLDMGYPGFTLDYDGEGDKLWENPIKGSKVKAKFIVSDTDDHTFFQNLAVEDEGTAALVIYKNTELFYIGRIISDQMQYERRPEKNTVYTITATDGLSLLNRYKVEYSWFDSTTERLDILNLIRYSLAKTTIPDYYDHLGYEDNYLVDASIDFPTGDFDRLNVFEINLSSVINDFTSFMEQETLYTDEDLFVDCQTAIERVLRMLYSRIIYTNSRFYIYDPIDYAEKAQSISVEYGTDGTQTGKISTLPQYTVGDGSRPCFAAFPIYTHQPAIREIKQNFTRQAINRLIRPFSAFSTNSMQLTTPSIGYVASEERELNVKAIINFISASFSGTTPPNQLFHEINFRIYVSDNFGYKHYDYQNQTWTSTQSSLPFFERIRCEVTDYEVINSKYAKFKLDFARTFNPPAASDDVVVEISMGKLTWSWGTTRNAVAMWGALYMYEKDSASMSVVTTNDKNLNATEKEEFETIYGYEFTGNTLKGIGTIWNSDTSNPSGITASDWSVRQGACYVDAPKTASAQLVDDGDYYPLLTPQFDSESYTFNGGTFNAQDETWDFELIQLAQDVANISSDELDFQDTTNGDDKRNAAVRRLIDQTNVLRDSVSSFDTSLPTDIIRLSDESHTTTPSYDTLFTPYVKYDLNDDTLVWLAREEGKSKTITSSETFDDTVSFYQIDTGLNTVQLTLPLPSTVKGKEFTFKKTSPANTVELAGTIDGGTGYFMDYNNETVVLVSDGSEYIIKAEYGKDDLTDVTDRDNTTDNTVGVGALQLNLTPTATPTEGMLYWDEDEETAAVQVNGMNYEIGQGLYWVAKNQTGVQIDKGTAVYASGTLGSSGRLLISPMIADGTIQAKYFLGITAEDIANGDDGKVITQGKLRQLDTSAFTAGNVLWVSASTAGDLTSTQPTGTNDIALAVAFVVDASTNGMIAVRVSNLDENDITDIPTLDEVTTEGNTTTNDIEVGGLNVDSGTLYVDSTNNRVGIGTTSPARQLHLSGDYIRMGSSSRIIIESASASKIQFKNTAGSWLSTESKGINIGDWSTDPSYGDIRVGDYDFDVIKTDGTHLIKAKNNGNVLIGTTTDSGTKLQIQDAGADLLDLTRTGVGTYRFAISSNDRFSIYDVGASSERLGVAHTGNVLIGTTTDNGARLNVQVSGASLTNVIRFGDASPGYLASGTSGVYLSDSSGTARFMFKHTGEVGIGTSSPSYKLDVSGDSTSGVVRVKNAANGRDTLQSANAGGTRTFNIGNDGSGHGIVLVRNSSGTTTTYIAGSGNSYFNGGNVGIGTSSPAATLNVYNVAAAPKAIFQHGTTDHLSILIGTNGGGIAVEDNNDFSIFHQDYANRAGETGLTTRFRINSSGDVGIGTTSPSDKLHVSGGNMFLDNGYGLRWGDNSVGIYGNASNETISMYTSSSERMRITSGGNLLIGTTTDSGYKVQIKGSSCAVELINSLNNKSWRPNINGTDFYITESGVGNPFVIKAGGNVGIGTTSPSEKLEVAGNIQASGSRFIRAEYDSNHYMQLESNSSGGILKGLDGGTTTVLVRSYGDTYFNGGSFGIGQSSPTARLEVIGTIKQKTGSGYANYVQQSVSEAQITFSTYSNNQTNHPSAIKFSPNGTEAVRIDNDGNLGVGTSSPSSLLQVQSGVGNTQLDGHQILLSRAGNNHIFATSASGVLALGTNNAEKMRITSGGNVLIGTTSDGGQKLQVNGMARFDSTVYVGEYITHLGDGDTALRFLDDSVQFNAGGVAMMKLTEGSADVVTINPDSADVNFQVNGDTVANLLFVDAGTSNVGIGTSSPSQKLQVSSGDIMIDSGNAIHLTTTADHTKIQRSNNGLELFAGSSARVHVNDGGNVGIGTTSPSQKLSVATDTDVSAEIGRAHVGYVGFGDYAGFSHIDRDSAGNYALLQAADGETFLNASSGQQINFRQNNVDKMRLFGDGNFAIGTTTNNGYIFNVNGDATINGVRVGRGAGNVDGNTVLGSGAFNSNSTGLQNTAIGYQSLRNNTGQYNTALGFQAGYSNTTGERNTAIGRHSLYSNSTGSYNTSLGMNSLTSSTASNNTALGYGTLFNATTATKNTAVGVNALTNTTSSNNTAIGYEAGLSNTTGSITAVGYQALKANTTGGENVAVGRESMRLATASNNTAVGTYSGYVLTTGSGNTMVGRRSLFTATTANYNTALGYQALKNNATSSSNTAVGLNSLVNTTGNSNTAIGTYAGDANTTGSNNIFIGFDSEGVSVTDSNRTFIGNSSTTSTWVGGNLLVGTTTDSGYKLNVNGTAYASEFDLPSGGQLDWANGDARIKEGDVSNYSLSFQTYTGSALTTKMFISGSGNIGVGTTSPSQLLHLSRTGTNPYIRISSDSFTGLDIGQETSAGNGVINLRDNKDIRILTNGTDVVRIKNTGNVGIGTTSPNAQMHVYSSGNGEIEVERASGALINLQAQASLGTIGTDSNHPLHLKTNSTTRAFISTNGYVGLGTTSPARPLHVSSSATSIIADFQYTGAAYSTIKLTNTGGNAQINAINSDLTLAPGGTERMRIANTGNVGIGTTSPSNKLHVVGDFFLKGSNTSSSTKNFQVQTGNGTSIMDFRNDAYAFFGCGQGGGSASGFIFRYNSTFGVQFTGYNYGNGSSPSYKPILMDTDLAGRSQGVYVNYGITGYTAPAPTTTAEFAVRGRGTSSSFTAKFEDSSTNPLLYIKDNGNVMIGTGTDSGYKLDVEGDTNTNGDYYVNGTQGWSGTININTSPPVAITVEGGIITNVT